MKTSRRIFAGALALVLAAAATPGPAEAGPRSARVAGALDRIAVRVEDVRSIRNPHQRAEEIDRLQARLYRLEQRSARHRGRRARYNENTIYALQNRLARMERRNQRRIVRWERERYYDSQYAYPTYPDQIDDSEIVVLDPQRRLDLEITRDGVRVGIDR